MALVSAIRDAGVLASAVFGDLVTEKGAASVIAWVESEGSGVIDILVSNIGGNESAGGGLAR